VQLACLAQSYPPRSIVKLLDAADAALYRDKQDGRDRVESPCEMALRLLSFFTVNIR
jgi:hypothetical protein